MKITFLGSSHGVPEPNRNCSCAMIEIGDNRYFIDMGKDPMTDIVTRSLPIDSIKGIFITHMHEDHTFGLLHFIGLATWRYKTADPVIYLPCDIQDAKRTFNSWLELNAEVPREFRYFEVKEGVIFEDESIKITAYLTKHKSKSFAFLVEAEGKRVLFSGDLSKDPRVDFPMKAIEEEVDLAICEVAHFNPEVYLEIFGGKNTVKRLCFNHYSNRYMEYIFKVIPQLEMPVFLANDGMEIVL